MYQQKSESGRSLLEVVFVIGVITLLMIISSLGYSYVSFKYREKESVKQVSELAIRYRLNPVRPKEGTQRVVLKSVYPEGILVEGNEALITPDTPSSRIYLRSNEDKKTFNLLIKQTLKGTCERLLENGNYDMVVFKEGVSAEDALNSEGEEVENAFSRTYLMSSEGKEIAEKICEEAEETRKVATMGLIFDGRCSKVGKSYWYKGRCWNCPSDQSQDIYGACCAALNECGVCSCPEGACNAETKTCVECTNDSHCAESTKGSQCDVKTNECVVCVDDTACGEGSFCTSGHTCIQCDTQDGKKHLIWNSKTNECECAKPLLAVGQTCSEEVDCCAGGTHCYEGICSECSMDKQDTSTPGACNDPDHPVCKKLPSGGRACGTCPKAPEAAGDECYAACDACPASKNLTCDTTQNQCVCADGQHWNGSVCVECTHGTHCAVGQTCGSSETCEACAKDSLCGGCQAADAAKPYWNGTQCVECLANGASVGGCSDPEKPSCNTETQTCEACPADKPYWNGSACVECTDGAHCAAGQTCGSSETCEACTKDSLCGGCQAADAAKAYWNGTQCVECLANGTSVGGCSDPEKPSCNTEKQTCEACPADKPHWDGLQCVECVGTEHCSGRTDGKNTCDTVKKVCTECPENASEVVTDQQIGTTACYCKKGYVVDTTGTGCVEWCTSDADCAGRADGKKTCDLKTRQCVDCPEGYFFEDGQCKTCGTDRSCICSRYGLSPWTAGASCGKGKSLYVTMQGYLILEKDATEIGKGQGCRTGTLTLISLETGKEYTVPMKGYTDAYTPMKINLPKGVYKAIVTTNHGKGTEFCYPSYDSQMGHAGMCSGKYVKPCPVGSFLDPTSNECTTCLAHYGSEEMGACTDPARPWCDPFAHGCSVCPANKPYWNDTLHTCAECASDTDCAGRTTDHNMCVEGTCQSCKDRIDVELISNYNRSGSASAWANTNLRYGSDYCAYDVHISGTICSQWFSIGTSCTSKHVYQGCYTSTFDGGVYHTMKEGEYFTAFHQYSDHKKWCNCFSRSNLKIWLERVPGTGKRINFSKLPSDLMCSGNYNICSDNYGSGKPDACSDPDKPLCDKGSYTCKACPNGTYWNVATNSCTSCLANYTSGLTGACTNAKAPMCDPISYSCQACPAGTHWNATTKMCSECLTNYSSGKAGACGDSAKPLCDSIDYTCKVCPPDKPYWNDTVHECVKCATNTDCSGTNFWCDTTGSCVRPTCKHYGKADGLQLVSTWGNKCNRYAVGYYTDPDAKITLGTTYVDKKTCNTPMSGFLIYFENKLVENVQVAEHTYNVGGGATLDGKDMFQKRDYEFKAGNSYPVSVVAVPGSTFTLEFSRVKPDLMCH